MKDSSNRRGHGLRQLPAPDACRSEGGGAAAGDRPVRRGSMTAFPYSAAGCDVVLSPWTAFYELVEEDEQVAALREMSRVLRPAGIGIVEGSVDLPPTDTAMAAGGRP